MWKIICLFSLFVRALSAPSGCIEMCNAMNSQSRQRMNCCGLPMVSSPNDDKNWIDHNDFQTSDGALVHTKDGKYSHGNTHGSFNEMSYYKEFGSGSNFGNNQHHGSNLGINQKIEDLATLSQSSFEASFQSKFAGLIQNFHDSFNHLQELKSKGQLQTQECVHPCVPVNEQITQLQEQVRNQQQYIQRMREDFWRRSQKQTTVEEAVERIPVVQQPIQPSHYPGQIVKEVNHHETYRNEKIITHPRITTKVTYQPDKYVNSQQILGSESTNQGYRESSTTQQGSSRYNQDYGSQIQDQAGSTQQGSSRYIQDYGSQIQGHTGSIQQRPSQHIQDYESGNQGQVSLTQHESRYTQNYGSGVQSQVGSTQQGSSRYTQDYGSGIQGQIGSTQLGSSRHTQDYGSGIQSQAGYDQQTSGYGSQSQYGSRSQNGYIQRNSAHGPQISGSLIDGSQGCGPQGCVTHVSHGSVTHSSMTHNYGVGFGSNDGSLTHGVIGMGTTPDCNDESHPQSYSQVRRHKRHSLYRFPHAHHPHHHNHHRHADDSQEFSNSQQVQQSFQDFPQQTNLKVEDFGEPAKIQKVSQQEIQNLGHQVQEISQGKLHTQDINQQTQDFTQQTQDLTPKTQDLTQQTLDFTQQQNHGFDDYSQQSGKLEFGQHPSQIESLSQQTQGFDDSPKPEKIKDLTQQSQIIDDFSQHQKGFDQQTVGNLKLEEFGQHHQQHSSQIPSLTQQTQDFTQQQNHGFDDFPQQSGKLEFGQQHQQYPSQIPSLSQQTQDFTQQQNHGFNDFSQQTGELEFGQHPSQIPSLSQQTQDFTQQQNHGFDDFSQQSGKLEFGQHQQHPSQIESLSQQTQGFGDFPKPEKIEDLTQQSQIVDDFSQHQRGFDQQTVGNLKFDQPARDSLIFNTFPTPVLAPDNNEMKNQRFDGLNQQFNLPAKPAPKPTSRPRNPESSQFNVDKNSDTERIFNTDQKLQSPFRENLRNTGRGDISAETVNSQTDQALTPHMVSDTEMGYQQSSKDKYNKENFDQQVQTPDEIFFQQAQNSERDFTQIVQKQSRDFSQEAQNPFLNFSQQNQKSFGNFSHQILKPFDDFSQQNQKSFEDFSQQNQKSFENIPQQDQKPFENFSQQIQRPRESLSPQMSFEDFSQKVQGAYKDFSQISDLNRDKDITQLPQEPKGGLTQSHKVQNKLIDHINSDNSQQIQKTSFGAKWHRSHNPGDLTNENLHLEKFSDQIQQMQQGQENQQEQVQKSEKISKNEEKHFIRFSQSVESQGSNLKLRNEETTELSLQPRILEAYGGRGHYDPWHTEDIFSGARQNPSATLPPFYEGDPWDIREKPAIPDEIYEDRVIPLDPTWVFPDSLPDTSVTEAPKPGFWGRVGHKITGAVDKAKEKARGIFG